MTTALFTHRASDEHMTPIGHPERVERLAALEPALADLSLLRREAPPVDHAYVKSLHSASYVSSVADAIPHEGFGRLDADTWLAPGSMTAALCAAGAAKSAVDLVVDGQVKNAFCAMRPPGHHAERAKAMGFCLFGTVALAAKYALDTLGLERVAVIDFDVHHGNGTQDLLWDEERALFITSQQMPLWPGTGDPSERGMHDTILNLPLPEESGGREMRETYLDHAFPRLRDFSPDLILLSAGFDAHRYDPLAMLEWETEDFRWLTREICQIAEKICSGRLVSCLEGGYDLGALAESGRAHVEELIEAGQ